MVEVGPTLAGKSSIAAADITISERSPLTLIQVTAFPQDRIAVCAALAAGLGMVPATIPPNSSLSDGRITVLWLGPDRWLVVEPRDARATTWRASATTAGGVLTDLSHGRTVIRVAGAAARALLARGVGPDLHPAMFPPGACLQTRVAHTNVLLHAVDDVPSFDLYVPRSYAADFWDWLRDAAATARSHHS